MMAATQPRRRKWGYAHFRCDDDLREIVEKYAAQNERTFSAELEATVRKAYGVEKKKLIVLPPLMEQLSKPTQDRPGRKRPTA